MELITTTTILLASMNVFNNDCNFAYDTNFCDNVVSSRTVYEKSNDGKYLSKHLKYNYVYDAQQRLARKEVMRWDTWSNEWVKSHCLNYTYDANGYAIEYVQWDAKSLSYAEVMEKQTYHETVNGAMAICSYSWDKKENQWVLKENIMMLKTEAMEFYTTQLQAK